MTTDEIIKQEAERRELLALGKSLTDRLDLSAVPLAVKSGCYSDPAIRSMVCLEFSVKDDRGGIYRTILTLGKWDFDNPIHLRQMINSSLTRLGMLLLCGNAKFDGVALYPNDQ